MMAVCSSVASRLFREYMLCSLLELAAPRISFGYRPKRCGKARFFPIHVVFISWIILNLPGNCCKMPEYLVFELSQSWPRCVPVTTAKFVIVVFSFNPELALVTSFIHSYLL